MATEVQQGEVFQKAVEQSQAVIGDPSAAGTPVQGKEAPRSLLQVMTDQGGDEAAQLDGRRGEMTVEPSTVPTTLPTDGAGAVEARLTFLDDLAARVRDGSAGKGEVEDALSKLPMLTNPEVGVLWGEDGAALRGRRQEAMKAMGEAFPDAVIRGQLTEHESNLDPSNRTHLKQIIAGAGEPSPELDRMSGDLLVSMAKEKIIENRTSPLGFQVAMMPLTEALNKGDMDAVKGMAQDLIARFGDQSLGLMPWLESLAGAE